MSHLSIQRVGVVGAGQMGSGIAQVAAGKGLEVFLSDISLEVSEKGKAKIASSLSKLVEKGKIQKTESDDLLSRIFPVEGYGSFDKVDIAIEAVTENVEIKSKIFIQMDKALPKNSILASNTSSISITRLAALTSRPTKVIGMHFMNPVPLMKLVEIIRGIQTSDETYQLVKEMATGLGKTVITSKDFPGFIVNRILIPFLNEACFALQEGLSSVEEMDTGAKLGLNHPMGPFELADLIGLDTVLSIAEVLYKEFGDSKYRPSALLRNVVAAGWLGKKSGKGFYLYDPKGQRLQANTI